MGKKIIKSDEEWRRELKPELFKIARESATEAPFSGEYCETHDAGTYMCAACGSPLFDSEDKFDSGTGWPSFMRPADPGGVETRPDLGLMMVRTEVRCSSCGAHLGHVFDDGPAPGSVKHATGERYCINSVSLRLEKDSSGARKGTAEKR